MALPIQGLILGETNSPSLRSHSFPEVLYLGVDPVGFPLSNLVCLLTLWSYLGSYIDELSYVRLPYYF